MKTRKWMSAALAVWMTGSALSAFAQPGPRDDADRNGPRQNQEQQQPQQQRRQPGPTRQQADQPQQRPQNSHPVQRHENSRHDDRIASREDGRGVGPDNRYHRGDRLPPDMRGHQYVVNDWRGHGLQAPPRGQRWVQVGADYVLVAVATGVITSLILSGR